MKNTTQAYGTWYRTVCFCFGPQIGSEFNWCLPVVLNLIKNKNKFFPQFWAARHNKNLILCLDLANGPDLHHEPFNNFETAPVADTVDPVGVGMIGTASFTNGRFNMTSELVPILP
jgi:hypothetical protein